MVLCVYDDNKVRYSFFFKRLDTQVTVAQGNHHYQTNTVIPLFFIYRYDAHE